MSGVRNIAQLKDVVVLTVHGFNTAKADGHIGLEDLPLVFKLVPDLVAAIDGAGEIPAEVTDLQDDELDELAALVVAELSIDDAKALRIIAASFKFLSAGVGLGQAIAS